MYIMYRVSYTSHLNESSAGAMSCIIAKVESSLYSESVGGWVRGMLHRSLPKAKGSGSGSDSIPCQYFECMQSAYTDSVWHQSL